MIKRVGNCFARMGPMDGEAPRCEDVISVSAVASESDSDEEEWMRGAEMLQRMRLTQNAAGSDDKSRALERAIADSVLPEISARVGQPHGGTHEAANLGRGWNIRTDAAVGRHLIATRALKTGTIVFVESPLVVGHASASAAVGERGRPARRAQLPRDRHSTAA